MKRYLALLTISLGLISFANAQSITSPPVKNSEVKLTLTKSSKVLQFSGSRQKTKIKPSILNSANGLKMRGVITPDQYREMLKKVQYKDDKAPTLGSPRKLHPKVQAMADAKRQSTVRKSVPTSKTDLKIKANPVKKPTNEAPVNQSNN
jgi:hypothetical protein